MSGKTYLLALGTIALLAVLALVSNQTGRADEKTSSQPTSMTVFVPTSAPITIRQGDKVPGQHSVFPSIYTENADDFQRAPAGCGTVNPMAVVVTLNTTAGCIKAAIDSQKKDQADFDVIRVDITGKGKFADAPVIPFSRKTVVVGTPTYLFDADKLDFKVGNVTVPASAHVTYETSGGRISVFSLKLYWMAGAKLTFADGPHDVTLVDSNGNFRLEDPATPPKAERDPYPPNGGRGDIVVVDFGNGDYKDSTVFPAGAPIGIYGRLYEVSASPDLTTATLKPYVGRTAFLHVDQELWEAELLGAKQALVVRGNRTPMPVPPGEYKVRELRQLSEGKSGANRHQFSMETQGWTFRGLIDPPGPGREIHLKLVEGETYELKVGGPITASVVIGLKDDKEGGLLFNLIQWDISGGRIPQMILWERGSWVGPPELTVEILDASEKSIDKFPIKFSGGPFPATWKPPAGLKGQFTAKLRYRNEVFGEMKIIQPPPFLLATDAGGAVVQFDFKPVPPPKPPAASQPRPAATPPPVTPPVVATKPAPLPPTPASTQPVNPQPGWLSLAKTYIASGKQTQAAEYLQKVIARDPNTPEGKDAAKLLADLSKE